MPKSTSPIGAKGKLVPTSCAIDSDSTARLPGGENPIHDRDDVPENWGKVNLAKIAHIQVGFPFNSEKFTEVSEGNAIPLIRIRDLQAGETVTYLLGPLQDSIMDEYLVNKGDVLIGMDGNFHVTRWAGRQGLLNQRIARLQNIDEDAPPDFIYYAIKTPVKQIEDNKHFTTVKHLSMGDLRLLSILWPSKNERKLIAYILRSVQETKEACERIIAATRQLKQSLLQYLFTYGPVLFDQADQVPLKETEIGLMPESWRIVQLREIIQKATQADPKKNPTEWFQYIDVSSVSNEKLRIINHTEYQGIDAPSRARKVVRTGDVIWATVRPSLKRIAVVPPELDGQICSTAFCVLRAKDGILDPGYLFNATTIESFVNRLSELQRGASYPAITDNNVRDGYIQLPSLSEQHEIAVQLSAVDAKLAAEESRRETLARLFLSLLHHLMTGKVLVTENRGLE